MKESVKKESSLLVSSTVSYRDVVDDKPLPITMNIPSTVLSSEGGAEAVQALAGRLEILLKRLEALQLPLVTTLSAAEKPPEKNSRPMTTLKASQTTLLSSSEFLGLYWTQAKIDAARETGMVEFFVQTVHATTNLVLGAYTKGDPVSAFEAGYLVTALRSVFETNASTLKASLTAVRERFHSRQGFRGCLAPVNKDAELNLYLAMAFHFIFTSEVKTRGFSEFDRAKRRLGENSEMYFTRVEQLGSISGMTEDELNEKLYMRTKDLKEYLGGEETPLPPTFQDDYKTLVRIEGIDEEDIIRKSTDTYILRCKLLKELFLRYGSKPEWNTDLTPRTKSGEMKVRTSTVAAAVTSSVGANGKTTDAATSKKKLKGDRTLRCARCGGTGHSMGKCKLSTEEARKSSGTPTLKGLTTYTCRVCGSVDKSHFTFWCPKNFETKSKAAVNVAAIPAQAATSSTAVDRVAMKVMAKELVKEVLASQKKKKKKVGTVITDGSTAGQPHVESSTSEDEMD